MPVQKRKALRMRTSLSCMSVPPGEDDGADERGEEQHRDDLEGQDVDAEDVGADVAGAPDRDQRVTELDLLGPEGVDEERDEDTEDEQRRHDGAPALIVVESRAFPPPRRPGE